MENCSSNTTSPGKWCDLPSDVLLLVSKKLDGKYDRQLSAVCASWNSSFPSKSKPRSNFPLRIPCPIIPTQKTKESVRSISECFTFWVVQRSVFLISPLKKEPENPAPWLVKVEESGLNKWSLFNPLMGFRISPHCCNSYQNDGVGTLFPMYINLLDFCITDITKSYSILWTDNGSFYHTHSCSPAELSERLGIKKVITFHDDVEGIIVFLSLHVDGNLASWKSGCEEWKMVDSFQPQNSMFVDIICFDGKFSVVDTQGNLLMIDPLTLKPVKSVAQPHDDRHDETYLVQCEEYLYLVTVDIYNRADYNGLYGNADYSSVGMLCFVLLGNVWVANGGFQPKSTGVFFLGNDVTYSLSPKHLDWSRGNFAFYGGILQRRFSLIKKLDLFMNMCSKESFSHYVIAEDYELDAIYHYNNNNRNLTAEDYELYGIFEYNNEDRDFKWLSYDCSARTNIFCPPPDWERYVHCFRQLIAKDLVSI